jgi:hypothetical protein
MNVMAPIMPPLHGKVTLVTGGSRGIGRATALALARVGAKVAVNYKTHATEAEEVCTEVRNIGGHVMAVQADVSISAQVAACLDEIQQGLPGISLGILLKQLVVRDEVCCPPGDGKPVAFVSLFSAARCQQDPLAEPFCAERARVMYISEMRFGVLDRLVYAPLSGQRLSPELTEVPVGAGLQRE